MLIEIKALLEYAKLLCIHKKSHTSDVQGIVTHVEMFLYLETL